MKNLRPIGRILFVIPFLFFGINHFIEVFQGYEPQYNTFIPLGPFTIILTGIILSAASIGIMFKKFVRISAVALAVLLFLFIATIHVPSLFADPTDKIAMINLFKDIALLGGSIWIVGFWTEYEKE